VKDTSRLKEKHLEAQKDSFINHTVNALVGKKERLWSLFYETDYSSHFQRFKHIAHN
jgi:hypothetical protein